MADTLGSVGVIISTLLINRYGWTGFDPLASIFIAVLIFASVVPLVVDSGKLLVLDLGEEKEAEVRKALTAVSFSLLSTSQPQELIPPPSIT
jgi:zinc transporter 5/7